MTESKRTIDSNELKEMLSGYGDSSEYKGHIKYHDDGRVFITEISDIKINIVGEEKEAIKNLVLYRNSGQTLNREFKFKDVKFIANGKPEASVGRIEFVKPCKLMFENCSSDINLKIVCPPMKKDNDDEFLKDIKISLRAVEVVGQIMKNRYGSI